MKTLILAAGRSRRAKPIEDKNFLEFNGKPLIQHQVEMLRAAGFEDIIIVGGEHNLPALQPLAEQLNCQTVEQKPLEGGMAAGVLAAESLVQDEALFIVSSNDMVDPEAFKAMKSATESDADAYLLAYEVDSYFPGGYLQVDNGRITDIIEKPGAGKEPSNLVNLVLHYYKNPASLFQALHEAESQEDDVYEVAMNTLMKEQQFEAVPYSGFWQPIKFPWHVLDVMDHFLTKLQAHTDPTAQIAESATIKGAVHIAAGAKIFDGAVIQGPAYIGENTVVGNGALVRNSMVAANSVVGFSTEIARSHIARDCWFHSNYVGDSVLGENCSFGAGAVLANLRLDEAEIKESGRDKLGAILGNHIRVGVNTNLMPGVRVGSNSMIGSGLTIAEDIDANKFVYGKTELIQKENRIQVKELKRS